ncbi:enoyl-CoA hydratase/isomerase family protein [Pseudohaliea sp.]|uniref:enoyl-CoA hydratase/isomerase family protein n=1 Tax=Pseudohaliea sp. TaxID=2740289 RepID=UPI0032EC27CC
MALKTWSAEELLACCRAGRLEEQFAAPLGDGVVLLLLEGNDGLSDAERRALRGWLRRAPCPVIGIGDTELPLAGYCDLCAGSEAEALALAERIQRWPGAARVLVQTLRASEQLSPEQGLDLESLAYATLQGGQEHRAWLASRPAPAPPALETGAPLLVTRSGQRLCLSLNRPRNHNALSAALRDALFEALTCLALDPDIEQCELRARGDCFSIGGDLSEFGLVPDTTTAHLLRGARSPARLLLREAGRVTVYVHRACIGAGIEIPACAGRVVAERNAWFQLPELSMGLIPGAGGCVSVSRRIGRQRTAWMVVSGRRVKAAEALRWGLIDEIA